LQAKGEPKPSQRKGKAKKPTSRLAPECAVEALAYPAGFDRPDVRAAALKWLKYKRGSYKDPVAQASLLLARSPSPAAFIGAIDESYANGWAGCWPERWRPPKQEVCAEAEDGNLGIDWSKLGQARGGKAK
jgi:hypothetical protein